MSLQSQPREGSTLRNACAASDPFEDHFSLQEIADKWGVDYETVRKEFIDREGVLILGDQGRKDGKRTYLTIRVPKHVLEQAYRERTTRKFHSVRRPATTVSQPTKRSPDNPFPRRVRRRSPPDKQKSDES
jgi:hypothetical protein